MAESCMSRKERALAINDQLKKLYPIAQSELTYNKPYEFLFAVILSAQTTDKQVNTVTTGLFQKYQTLDSFANADIEVLQNDLKSIGLYKNKAKNIKATAQQLIQQHNGAVPQTMADLIALPGVARKTANVVLGQLYGINEGIAVDTHVKRLSRLLGLTENGDPVKIERDLMQLIPQEDWSMFSLRLILYGRYYWTAKQQSHDGPLAPYAVDEGK